jgi:hypothetical protein
LLAILKTGWVQLSGLKEKNSKFSLANFSNTSIIYKMSFMACRPATRVLMHLVDLCPCIMSLPVGDLRYRKPAKCGMTKCQKIFCDNQDHELGEVASHNSLTQNLLFTCEDPGRSKLVA